MRAWHKGGASVGAGCAPVGCQLAASLPAAKFAGFLLFFYDFRDLLFFCFWLFSALLLSSCLSLAADNIYD